MHHLPFLLNCVCLVFFSCTMAPVDINVHVSETLSIEPVLLCIALSLSRSLSAPNSVVYHFRSCWLFFFSFLGKRQTPRIFATHRIAEALYCEDDVNTYNFNSVVPLSPSIRYIAIERATKRQEPRRKFVSFAIVVAVEVLRFILSFICCYCSFFSFFPRCRTFHDTLYISFSLSLYRLHALCAHSGICFTVNGVCVRNFRV